MEEETNGDDVDARLAKEDATPFSSSLGSYKVAAPKSKETEELGIDVCTLGDGSTYLGNVLDGFPHGIGLCKYGNGDLYQGHWNQSLRYGLGVATFSSTGDVYEGMFSGNKPHGKGRYLWADGSMHVGEFRNGVPHGLCMFQGRDGRTYLGQYRDSKCSGYGVYYYPNGDIYTGQFMGNVRQGFGMYTFGDHSREPDAGEWGNDSLQVLLSPSNADYRYLEPAMEKAQDCLQRVMEVFEYVDKRVLPTVRDTRRISSVMCIRILRKYRGQHLAELADLESAFQALAIEAYASSHDGKPSSLQQQEDNNAYYSPLDTRPRTRSMDFDDCSEEDFRTTRNLEQGPENESENEFVQNKLDHSYPEARKEHDDVNNLPRRTIAFAEQDENNQPSSPNREPIVEMIQPEETEEKQDFPEAAEDKLSVLSINESKTRGDLDFNWPLPQKESFRLNVEGMDGLSPPKSMQPYLELRKHYQPKPISRAEFGRVYTTRMESIRTFIDRKFKQETPVVQHEHKNWNYHHPHETSTPPEKQPALTPEQGDRLWQMLSAEAIQARMSRRTRHQITDPSSMGRQRPVSRVSNILETTSSQITDRFDTQPSVWDSDTEDDVKEPTLLFPAPNFGTPSAPSVVSESGDSQTASIQESGSPQRGSGTIEFESGLPPPPSMPPPPLAPSDKAAEIPPPRIIEEDEAQGYEMGKSKREAKSNGRHPELKSPRRKPIPPPSPPPPLPPSRPPYPPTRPPYPPQGSPKPPPPAPPPMPPKSPPPSFPSNH